MNMAKLLGLLLIAAGTLSLVYGGFTYTRANHEAKLGPIELSIKRDESVSVPVWAGAGAVAVGALLLLLGGRKR